MGIFPNPATLLRLSTLRADADFDNAPQDAMTPLFYAHAYTELDLAVRDLLDIIHRHTDR